MTVLAFGMPAIGCAIASTRGRIKCVTLASHQEVQSEMLTPDFSASLACRRWLTRCLHHWSRPQFVAPRHDTIPGDYAWVLIHGHPNL